MRSLKNVLLFILFLFLVLWLARKQEWMPAFKNPFRAEPISIENTPLLLKNIRSISQLLTIAFYDEVIVDSTRSSARLLPLPPFVFPIEASLVLVVKGRLIAGLDLSTLDSSAFSGNRDSLHIQLPRAKVLDVIINPTDVETFSEKGQWNQQAVAALKIKAKNVVMRNALAQGVLRRSDEKAKSLVEQLMIHAGYKKVVVSIEK